MDTKISYFAIFIGLVGGLLIMFLFHLVTPRIELAYLVGTGVERSEDIAGRLTGSIGMNTYYVASMFLTVFTTTILATVSAKHRRKLAGFISGGMMYILLLVNPEMIRDQLLTYFIFVILGVVALWLPARLLKAS